MLQFLREREVEYGSVKDFEKLCLSAGVYFDDYIKWVYDNRELLEDTPRWKCRMLFFDTLA